jgi:hypothetical protein
VESFHAEDAIGNPVSSRVAGTGDGGEVTSFKLARPDEGVKALGEDPVGGGHGPVVNGIAHQETVCLLNLFEKNTLSLATEVVVLDATSSLIPNATETAPTGMNVIFMQMYPIYFDSLYRFHFFSGSPEETGGKALAPSTSQNSQYLCHGCLLSS